MSRVETNRGRVDVLRCTVSRRTCCKRVRQGESHSWCAWWKRKRRNGNIYSSRPLERIKDSGPNACAFEQRDMLATPSHCACIDLPLCNIHSGSRSGGGSQSGEKLHCTLHIRPCTFQTYMLANVICSTSCAWTNVIHMHISVRTRIG